VESKIGESLEFKYTKLHTKDELEPHLFIGKSIS